MEAVRLLDAAGIDWVSCDPEIIEAAAALKARGGLSVADAWMNAQFITLIATWSLLLAFDQGTEWASLWRNKPGNTCYGLGYAVEMMGFERDGELARLVLAAEAAVLAGDGARAVDLYEALRPHEDARVQGEGSALASGSVGYYLGLLARTAGRLEPAVRHLERALGTHTAAGDDGWVARVRCELARVLLARGDTASRRRALAEVDAVLMWAGAAGTAPGDEAAGLRLRAERVADGALNVIRCEGEFWTVSFDGWTCHVRDTKGLHWLAVLLRHPGREFPALALVSDGIRDVSAVDLADSAAIERARVRVTRALHNAVARLAGSHPALGSHLASTLRTGRVCAYTPDARLPIEWGD